MEIIHLLIVSKILGSIAFAEACSCLRGCFNLGRKYKRFIKQSSSNQSSTISKCDEISLLGMKFDPLEVLEAYRGEGYPNCNSFKALQFSSADDQENTVLVSLLKFPWKNEIAIDDPEKAVTLFYEMSSGTAFILDKDKFPNDSEEFGMESIQEYMDEKSPNFNSAKISEIINLHFGIRDLLENFFQLDVIYMSSDKSYAIFRTLTHQCTWIGWNSTEAKAIGLTEEITDLLNMYRIKYRQFRPQDESSGSKEGITSMFSINDQHGWTRHRLSRISEGEAGEDETSEIETDQNETSEVEKDQDENSDVENDQDEAVQDWTGEHETDPVIYDYVAI